MVTIYLECGCELTLYQGNISLIEQSRQRYSCPVHGWTKELDPLAQFCEFGCMPIDHGE